MDLQPDVHRYDSVINHVIHSLLCACNTSVPSKCVKIRAAWITSHVDLKSSIGMIQIRMKKKRACEASYREFSSTHTGCCFKTATFSCVYERNNKEESRSASSTGAETAESLFFPPHFSFPLCPLSVC